jgi:hypothetical protein
MTSDSLSSAGQEFCDMPLLTLQISPERGAW